MQYTEYPTHAFPFCFSSNGPTNKFAAAVADTVVADVMDTVAEKHWRQKVIKDWDD